MDVWNIKHILKMEFGSVKHLGLTTLFCLGKNYLKFDFQFTKRSHLSICSTNSLINLLFSNNELFSQNNTNGCKIIVSRIVFLVGRQKSTAPTSTTVISN